MARYPMSGVATGVPDATSSINIIGRALTSGRKFRLLKAWAYKDTLESDELLVCDASTSATAEPASTLRRYTLQSDYGKGQKVVDFPEPGLEFKSGCVVAVEGTATGYSLVGGLGYEVG